MFQELAEQRRKRMWVERTLLIVVLLAVMIIASCHPIPGTDPKPTTIPNKVATVSPEESVAIKKGVAEAVAITAKYEQFKDMASNPRRHMLFADANKKGRVTNSDVVAAIKDKSPMNVGDIEVFIASAYNVHFDKGIAASGRKAIGLNEGPVVTIARDRKVLPEGSEIQIFDTSSVQYSGKYYPGGNLVIEKGDCHDTGHPDFISGRRIDIGMATEKEAEDWGLRFVIVKRVK